MSADADSLERFIQAQAPVYAQACAELRAGAKRSHWMWFVFPQLRGLGRTATAQHYGLAGADEALAYWRHPVLGPRLKACVELLMAVPAGRTALQILGSPDDLKLRSCLTLFAQVAPEEPLFAAALARYCAGQPDPLTLQMLGTASAGGPGAGAAAPAP